jgi:predicted glycosyltransferase involved in capsule biosynthesis
MINLSVIIPYCYGGDEQRLTALENTFKCIKAQTMTDFEIIVVEELVKVEKPSFPYCDNINQFIVLKDPEKRWYNKSWCINVGTKKAISENILVLDADVIFGKEYFKFIIEFAKNHKFFHGYSWIALMHGKDNPIIRIKPHSDTPFNVNETQKVDDKNGMYGVWATGGSWFFDKTFYWNVLGGMNENYFGYGGEDGDMYQRVKHIFNNKIPELNYVIVHQYHNWHPENGANPIVDYQKMSTLSHITAKNPQLIINKLKEKELGKIQCPTLIEMY